MCIVTYQARSFLRDCLSSVYQNTAISFEVIVVDNNSSDGTAEMLSKEYPQVQYLANQRNEGFTRPMNQALRRARGRYLLQLNPDTLILPNAIDKLVEFMGTHAEVGICGPKVLNSDLTMQKQCRRGDSRPWAVITYFSGLAARFPKSKFFGQYLMSYIDENLTHPVSGVSGSCMLIRREVIDQIGYLDERYFAWQEDADYCLTARTAGWQVYYVPEVQIIHYGGMGGSRVEPYRSLLAWHRSYFLYYRKHFARDYFFLFNWIYYLAMFIKLLFSLLVSVIQKETFVTTPVSPTVWKAPSSTNPARDEGEPTANS
ncbi:MAG: glycosyltransferase family 2 protein [Chloroflexota bacterium]